MTQFIWPAQFACTLITENAVLPNSYSISISIEPIDKQANIALGFRKLRHFVENHLHNSIFICKDNPLAAALENVENNRVIFPSEPYDYCVGSILYTKFLTICDKYFDIEFITIDSAVGDHVQYTIIDPDECGLDLEGEHWWNSDTADTGTGNTMSWKELNIKEGSSFEPTIIQGGLNSKQL